MSKPLAPISLDLDDKWSYLMIHGEKTWLDYPSYLPVLVPRVLDFLDERGLLITFFIVGRDAELPRNHDLLAEISRRGHRIANHSHHHRPWLHRYSAAEIAEELDRSEEAIELATGEMPIGFRGPGFSLTNGVISELARRGYQYDATVFPNILNPLSRYYYFRTTQLTPEEMEERSELFGTFRDALRPNRTFIWEGDAESSLTEVPVTTFPGLRTPIHLSYVGYLGSKAKPIATAYFTSALAICRASGNPPSMLLHPLDFMGRDDEPDLGFFPGMNLSSQVKLDLAHHFLGMLESRFRLVSVEDYVDVTTPRMSRIPDYIS